MHPESGEEPARLLGARPIGDVDDASREGKRLPAEGGIASGGVGGGHTAIMRDAAGLVEQWRASSPAEPAALVVVDGDSFARCDAATFEAACGVLAATSGARVLVDREQQTPPSVRMLADLMLTTRDGVGMADGSDARDAVAAGDPVARALELADRAAAHPVATWTAVQVLRATEQLDVPSGLAVESAAYSTLLGGAEFAAWLSRRRPRRVAEATPRVALSRDADTLVVTLARPARRNAYDARMRDALLDALEIAVGDDDVHVTLRADGPDFCAGGDLDEFGSATDLAAAHQLRVRASVGALIHRLRDRVRVELHGACVGSGIEIPAFASEVVARPGTTMRLPELSMGLIPGAGGTVSLTRRMGRQRLLWWLLSGAVLDAERAHTWGVVDALN